MFFIGVCFYILEKKGGLRKKKEPIHVFNTWIGILWMMVLTSTPRIMGPYSLYLQGGIVKKKNVPYRAREGFGQIAFQLFVVVVVSILDAYDDTINDGIHIKDTRGNALYATRGVYVLYYTQGSWAGLASWSGFVSGSQASSHLTSH